MPRAAAQRSPRRVPSPASRGRPRAAPGAHVPSLVPSPCGPAGLMLMDGRQGGLVVTMTFLCGPLSFKVTCTKTPFHLPRLLGAFPHTCRRNSGCAVNSFLPSGRAGAAPWALLGLWATRLVAQLTLLSPCRGGDGHTSVPEPQSGGSPLCHVLVTYQETLSFQLSFQPFKSPEGAPSSRLCRQRTGSGCGWVALPQEAGCHPSPPRFPCPSG